MKIQTIFSRLLVNATFAIATLSGIASADDKADPFARDVLIISDWFDGEFDNEEQVWFQRDPRSAVAETHRHRRLHVRHTRLDLPAFGQHVFYVEEYADNDPSKLVRQRLVTFASDPAAGAIRMQQGFFKDANALDGAEADSDAIAALTPEDIVFLSECDVFWQREADQFVGQMQAKACVFGDGADRRYSVHNLWLSHDKYWRVDETYRVSDDSLFVGQPDSVPFKMRRTKNYICGMNFRPTPEGDPAESHQGIIVHSQGGTAEVTRDRDGAKFTLLLRDKEYPYYEDRPDFMYFSIRKSGEERSIAFSVHDVRSRTLGVSVAEFIAYCHLDGYQFRERYDEIL